MRHTRPTAKAQAASLPTLVSLGFLMGGALLIAVIASIH